MLALFAPMSPEDYFWTQIHFVKAIWPVYVILAIGLALYLINEHISN